MLLYRHQLDGVVAKGAYVFQVEICKFAIAAHTLLFLRHTDMGLVDVGWGDLALAIAAVGPLEGPWRRPYLAIEEML